MPTRVSIHFGYVCLLYEYGQYQGGGQAEHTDG